MIWAEWRFNFTAVSCFSDWWGVALTNLACLTEQDYPRTLPSAVFLNRWFEDRNCPYNFFLMAQQPLLGQDRLIIEVLRSHLLTPHSVGLLWTNVRPDAHNTQHSQQTEIYAPGGIRTHNPSKRAAADPCLRPRSRWQLCTMICQSDLNVHLIHMLLFSVWKKLS